MLNVYKSAKKKIDGVMRYDLKYIWKMTVLIRKYWHDALEFVTNLKNNQRSEGLQKGLKI